jgi:demethylmenaquinone methyltransferase/2-methoxy-6-polyprenyl-1,4-benzoquinol methylase
MNAPAEVQQQNAASFSPERDDVFGRIAGRYDLLCDLFSLGIHRLWKRAVAAEIHRQPWDVLLDGATGTGDIMLRVLSKEASARTIIASDISPKMMAVAAQRLGPHSERVRFETLDLESMPTIPSSSVDAYSISLGLKICDRAKALREAYRVLRPGGRLISLEASTIPVAVIQTSYLAYMAICMPALGWLATGGDASAYRYLLEGIKGFPSAEALSEEMQAHGFVDVAFHRLSLGIVAIHVATKPDPCHAALRPRASTPESLGRRT